MKQLRVGQTACRQQALKDISRDAKKNKTRNYVHHHADIVEFCKSNTIQIVQI